MGSVSEEKKDVEVKEAVKGKEKEVDELKIVVAESMARKNEIALAQKIELTRMAFRRKMLESDYCAGNTLNILQQVHEGTLSFDRTMKISTAENLIRSVIKKRMPVNIQTANKLLKINQKLLIN